MAASAVAGAPAVAVAVTNRPNRAAIEALVKRNAKACETATVPRCRCFCGGAAHGRAHSTQLIREAVATIERERSADSPEEIPSLFPFGGRIVGTVIG